MDDPQITFNSDILRAPISPRRVSLRIEALAVGDRAPSLPSADGGDDGAPTELDASRLT